MQTFSIVFLAALALATVTKLWLAMRHLRHIQRHRDRVPREFTNEISLEAHHKAADYSCAKTRLGIFSNAFECVVILVLTFGGGLQLLHDLTANWFEPLRRSGATARAQCPLHKRAHAHAIQLRL